VAARPRAGGHGHQQVMTPARQPQLPGAAARSYPHSRRAVRSPRSDRAQVRRGDLAPPGRSGAHHGHRPTPS
jgi:hypothetical protein